MPHQGDHRRVRVIAIIASVIAVASAPASAGEPVPGVRSIAAQDKTVWSIAFSPDSRLLATCGEDGNAALWDAATGERLHALTGHEGNVRSIAFAPDGATVVTAGFDHTLRVWATGTGAQRRVLRDTSLLFFPSILPGGDVVLVGSEEPEPRVFDLSAQQIVRKLIGHSATAWTVAVTRDGKLAASAGRDRTIRLWDTATWTCTRTLESHQAAVTTIAFAPGGSLLASGGGDGAVILWDTLTGRRVRDLAGVGGVYQVAFSPDGDTIGAAFGDGSVRLWGAASGDLKRTLYGGGFCLAFSPDGHTMASGAGSGRVYLWDVGQLAAPPGRTVDLRPNYERWGLEPRSQGGRGTCSVFTTVAAFEYALSRKLDRNMALSDEYLNWASNDAIGRQDDGGFFHDLLKGYEKHGMCLAQYMPYQRDFDPSLAPTEEARANAREVGQSGFVIHWISPWRPQAGLTDDQMAQIRAALDAGWPVALGSGHSVLAVGYTDDPMQPGGGTIVTRDSAAVGYCTVTYEHVKADVGDVFWVDLPLG
jgi:WD domain, G-beta repeat